jgi:hypothetical protein
MIAADVWDYVQAGDLLAGQRVMASELQAVHGLDASAPLVVAPTTREAGSLAQTIGQVGDTVTVVRA